MFFTFFPEFLHLDILRSLNLGIDIHYPKCDKMIDTDKPDLLELYRNNLKLFFQPGEQPSEDVLHKLEAFGFQRTFQEIDRWIFHFGKTN